MSIPDWFVYKVSGYPAGIRMPKLPKYWEAGGYRPQSWVGNLFRPSTYRESGDPLSGGDYRYWCGLESASTIQNKGFATCRACGEVVVTKKERKEHQKIGCGALLENAYKVLKRSTECIVCKKETHRKVYGLPMCNIECEHEWDFVTTTPSGLRYVLEDVERTKK